jgi:hypothetical protein
VSKFIKRIFGFGTKKPPANIDIAASKGEVK